MCRLAVLPGRHPLVDCSLDPRVRLHPSPRLHNISTHLPNIPHGPHLNQQFVTNAGPPSASVALPVPGHHTASRSSASPIQSVSKAARLISFRRATTSTRSSSRGERPTRPLSGPSPSRVSSYLRGLDFAVFGAIEGQRDALPVFVNKTGSEPQRNIVENSSSLLTARDCRRRRISPFPMSS